MGGVAAATAFFGLADRLAGDVVKVLLLILAKLGERTRKALLGLCCCVEAEAVAVARGRRLKARARTSTRPAMTIHTGAKGTSRCVLRQACPCRPVWGRVRLRGVNFGQVNALTCHGPVSTTNCATPDIPCLPPLTTPHFTLHTHTIYSKTKPWRT